MCNPALAFMAVSAVISAGTAYMSNERNNKMVEAQAESGNTAAKFDYQRLVDKGIETNEQASQEKLQRQLQTARERGRIMVAQGNAGVGGNSSLSVLNNTIMQERMDLSVIESNRAGGIRQINAEMKGVEAGAKSRSNEAKAGTISPVSNALTTGAAGIQGGISGYGMGKSLKKIN